MHVRNLLLPRNAIIAGIRPLGGLKNVPSKECSQCRLYCVTRGIPMQIIANDALSCVLCFKSVEMETIFVLTQNHGLRARRSRHSKDLSLKFIL